MHTTKKSKPAGQAASQEDGPLGTPRTGQGPVSGDRTNLRQARRLERVDAYLEKVLAKKNSLQANLGSINSGLMRIAVHMDEVINENLALGPASLDQIQRLAPTIETYLRVARQVDRFAQLETRAGQSPAKVAAPPKRKKAVAGGQPKPR
jgi:hypothetical protein